MALLVTLRPLLAASADPGFLYGTGEGEGERGHVVPAPMGQGVGFRSPLTQGTLPVASAKCPGKQRQAKESRDEVWVLSRPP